MQIFQNIFVERSASAGRQPRAQRGQRVLPCPIDEINTGTWLAISSRSTANWYRPLTEKQVWKLFETFRMRADLNMSCNRPRVQISYWKGNCEFEQRLRPKLKWHFARLTVVGRNGLPASTDTFGSCEMHGCVLSGATVSVWFTPVLAWIRVRLADLLTPIALSCAWSRWISTSSERNARRSSHYTRSSNALSMLLFS